MQPVWEAPWEGAGARQSRAALRSSLITVFSPLSNHHEGMSNHRRLIPFLAPFFLGTGWVKTQPPSGHRQSRKFSLFVQSLPRGCPVAGILGAAAASSLTGVSPPSQSFPAPPAFCLGTGWARGVPAHAVNTHPGSTTQAALHGQPVSGACARCCGPPLPGCGTRVPSPPSPSPPRPWRRSARAGTWRNVRPRARKQARNRATYIRPNAMAASCASLRRQYGTGALRHPKNRRFDRS